jgi:hypothetical protein
MSYPKGVLLKFRHPERSECAVFAQSKDPATFIPDDPRRTRPHCQWLLCRPALDGRATLLSGVPKMSPRSFDSAQPTPAGKVRSPFASLRMTELGNDTSLVPKLTALHRSLGTRLSAQFRCFRNGRAAEIGNGVASASVFPNGVWEQGNGSVALMPDSTILQRRSFDSAQPTPAGKVRSPFALLRMTELGDDTFAEVSTCCPGHLPIP